MKKVDLLVVGGGAGGFFSAINFAEDNPLAKVLIVEKSSKVLSKVKVSGGGRCNVTHACFIPRELVKYYPRGHKELLGPFHRFMTGDMMEWLENKGVSLKIEDDNRVFPFTDDSQTIVDCFLDEVNNKGIEVQTNTEVTYFEPTGKNWKITTAKGDFEANNLLLATGGNSKSILRALENLGIRTKEVIPSLFTFSTKDTRLRGMAGVSLKRVGIKIVGTKFKENGAFLITHKGISGPGVLKLSSVAARELHRLNYKFSVQIDWVPDYSQEEVKSVFEDVAVKHTKKSIENTTLFELPKRLWKSLVAYTQIPQGKVWGELSKKEQNKLVEVLKNSQMNITGKNTNKEEFVSCGGVDLKEMDFKRFSTKKYPNLYIVGELLDIDALTGGFNFQAVWTGAYIAAKSMVN